MKSTYRFSSDATKIDRAQVHRWLSEESHWAKGRTRATQDQAIDGSRNFGVYETDTGRQIAYARVVTDGVALVEGVVNEFAPLNLKRMLLSTPDAHGLYAKFGFKPLDSPSKWMKRPAQGDSQ
jgi:hypothetical protein